MSAQTSGSGLATRLAPEKPSTKGFLHIERLGGGPQALYIVKYYQLREEARPPRAVLAEGAHALIELLEKIGVDFRLSEVRGALEDILRLGSANIPDLWLSDEMIEKVLVEG